MRIIDMCTRREFINYSASGLILTSFCGLFPAVANSDQNIVSCLDDNFFNSITFYANSKGIIGDKPYQGDIFGASDDKAFDQALGEKVLEPLAQEFGVTPGFGYYDEQAIADIVGDSKLSSPNAFANPHARVQGTTGTVVFGLELLRDIFKLPNGEYIAIAYCAHEFAHIKQFEKKLDQTISQYSETKKTRFQELHADYLAGYFLGIFFRYKHKISNKSDLQRILNTIGEYWRLSAKGTKSNPGTHGTPEQRVAAIEMGYKYVNSELNPNIDEAFEKGKLYIHRIV